MFWRKKKDDISLPGDDDHRDAYRIRPVDDRPIILKMAGYAFYVVNISGTGCCIRSHAFKEGADMAGTLTLPSEDMVFPVTVRVVSRERDLCRCEFSKISPSAQNIIHAYVLDIQKIQIRPS